MEILSPVSAAVVFADMLIMLSDEHWRECSSLVPVRLALDVGAPENNEWV